jgi:ABC-type polysaccharide/polyol phosphate export permease
VHLWFFASPVLYYYGARTGRARTLLRLNPMSHLLVSYQQMLFEGHFDHWRGLFATVVVAALAFALGAFLFDRLRDTLAEEV